MECEWCKVDERKTGNSVHFSKYYHRHEMHLCMRCVDKLNSAMNGTDIDEYWKAADASEEGFPYFPMPYTKRRNKMRIETMAIVQGIINIMPLMETEELESLGEIVFEIQKKVILNTKITKSFEGNKSDRLAMEKLRKEFTHIATESMVNDKQA